jgi:hypothetical protein
MAQSTWFLAAGVVQQDLGVAKRVLWWLAQSVTLIVGLIVTIVFTPSLGFLVLVLPTFPLIFAMLSFAAAQVNNPWSYGIGASLFFAWMIAAVFPLAS